VVADDDGIVIIPEPELNDALIAARMAVTLEARILELVRLGKSPAEAVRLAQSE
jgi:regulator of RNase E activity RraA